MNAPRLREDLRAQPVLDGDVRYYEVSDPRSGSSMRLYEHEWLLATRMDGQSTLEQIASWSPGHLGFEPSSDDLATYARTLYDLGFLDEEPDAAPERARTARTKPSASGSFDDETSFADLDVSEPQRAASSVRPAPPMGTAPTVALPQISAEAPPSPSHSRRDALPTDPVLPVDAGLTSSPPISLRQISASSPNRPEPPMARTAPMPPVRQPRETSSQRNAPVTQVVNSVGGSSRSWLWPLVLVGIGALGAGAYVFVIGPAFATAKVKTLVAPSPVEMVKLFDGKATIARTPPVVLSFGEGGRVVDVAPVGTATKPGMALATLEGYAGLLKELNDVRDRETYYENAVKVAEAKKRRGDIKKNSVKVDEKRRLRVALEERIGKLRIVADVTSTVGEIVAPANSTVAAGAPVLKLADAKLLAEFKLAVADAALHKAGMTVTVQPAGSSHTYQAKVAAVDGATVKVELGEDAAALKPGTELSLVRSKTAKLIKIPASAVVKSQGAGADLVFVLKGQVVQVRTVTIADKSGDDDWISSGLEKGDSVVVAGNATLHDGQRAANE